jgi:hypothetical protein
VKSVSMLTRASDNSLGQACVLRAAAIGPWSLYKISRESHSSQVVASIRNYEQRQPSLARPTGGKHKLL